MIEKPIF